MVCLAMRPGENDARGREKFTEKIYSATWRRESNCGPRFGDVDAFDFQHGFFKQTHLVIGHFRREDLGETAFNFVQVGHVGIAKAEEFPIAAADDGQEFLFLTAM